ncbi:MAG: TonB-dependent receptor [Pyrinomonadaceae bacterium]
MLFKRLSISVSVMAVVLGAVALTCGIKAQQTVISAMLSGHIEDAGHGVIKGASVIVANHETNLTRTVVTDSEGRFLFLSLPVGDYTINVQAVGFAPLNRNFSLTVGQTADISLMLSVPSVVQKVDVDIDVQLIENARTQFSEHVLPREIDSLPLNGRNYLDLAVLTPGVSRNNPAANQRFPETSAVPGTGVSINGLRFINNGFVVDGLSANDDAADLPGTFYSQEVIREFEVITSGGVAQYGRASGGFVNIITKSGTNNYRGRVYGFFRNQRFDARNALTPRQDPLTQAQYGVSLSGPVARNRTFVFSNFEQTRLHNTAVVTISQAHVLAVNNKLDSLGYAGLRLATGTVPTGFETTNFLFRVDHQLNASNQLTARYARYDINGANARNVGGLNAVSRGTALVDRDQSIAISEVAVLSPKTVNEARFQYTRSRLDAAVNDPMGPAVNISGVANFGTATFSPTERDLDTFEYLDAIATQRGAHSIKAGLDFLLNRADIVFPGAIQGVYTFSSLADFQANRYTTFQQAFGAVSQFQSNPNVGWFVQDEWRVTPRLVINAGLRLDVQFLSSPIATDANNFAPRLGIAFAPGDRKTVFRAGFGLYFDRIPLRATSNALQRDGSKYRTAVLSFGQPDAPVFPQPLPAFPANLLASVTTIDPHIETSYNEQAGLQFERELSASTSLSIGYLFTRGLHIIVSRNVNVPAVSAATGIYNLGRPDSGFANINRYESSGESHYHALTVSLNRRFGRWFGFRLSYTLSKALDDVGNAFFFTPQNNFDLRGDWGPADNDQRHLLSVSGMFELPQSRSKMFLKRAGSGLQLSYIFRYGSHLPFNVLTGTDRNFDTNVNDRPGGVARNTGIGFNFAALDVRLSKSFRLTEKVRLEALVEAFNTLNRANYQLPNPVFGEGLLPLPNFGRPTSAADPRQIQFGLRLNF